MAKFLDKKERVLDLELTNYGKYLLSVGKFKPTYYAFYDDNVLYDGAYANITESQNNIHKRIKEDTPYLEGLVLFEDIDNKLQKIPRVDDTGLGIITIDTVPLEPEKPRFDNFRYNNAIGDSLSDSRDTSKVPSWKVLSLKGEITSSARVEDTTTPVALDIPQINMTMNYKKEIVNADQIPLTQESIERTQYQTAIFSDNKAIRLTLDDPMVYFDEVNTELLNENFDIEVFIMDSSSKTQGLTRKYFETKKEQIVDGIMVSDTPEMIASAEQLTKNAVEYYFEIRKDKDVDKKTACKATRAFNKQSYYLNLGFDCEQETEENFYNDIYGSEVIPEICLD
jgi:hypothetical protein